MYLSPYADGRIAFNLDELHSPKCHDEIVTIVREAYNNGKKVRVLAAGHSWSEIAQTQDIMLSLHEYSGLVDVDKESLLVTVKAGTQLRKLSELLEEEGLAMINLGSVAYQSIAGAISTG
jgi:FAD/FMN-containing dehydrogenase